MRRCRFFETLLLLRLLRVFRNTVITNLTLYYWAKFNVDHGVVWLQRKILPCDLLIWFIRSACRNTFNFMDFLDPRITQTTIALTTKALNRCAKGPCHSCMHISLWRFLPFWMQWSMGIFFIIISIKNRSLSHVEIIECRWFKRFKRLKNIKFLCFLNPASEGYLFIIRFRITNNYFENCVYFFFYLKRCIFRVFKYLCHEINFILAKFSRAC